MGDILVATYQWWVKPNEKVSSAMDGHTKAHLAVVYAVCTGARGGASQCAFHDTSLHNTTLLPHVFREHVCYASGEDSCL